MCGRKSMRAKSVLRGKLLRAHRVPLPAPQRSSAGSINRKEPPLSAARRSSPMARVAAAVAIAVVLACFALTFRAQWDTIAEADWRLEPGRFAVATVVLVVSFALV